MNHSPLWIGSDVVVATDGTCANSNWIATGVAIDSRTVENGDLFIAISGPNHDGHSYVKMALEKGATAAIVSAVPSDVPANANLVIVSDTLIAMENLGKAARARSSAKVIAITGSVGKTGTKEALAHILQRQGRTHYSVGSFNNHWGVPLSLSRMPADAEYGIFELGMNHAGELGPLSKMVSPHVAIITTVAAAHLEFFKNISDIALAKAEIFEGVMSDGAVFLNADNEHCDLLVEKAKQAGISNVVLFGEKAGSQIHLENVELTPQSSHIQASLFDENVSFTLSVPGRHWVQNVLAILGAVKHVGADVHKACDALGSMVAPSGRGASMTLYCDGGKFTVIDESYNASPIAMQAAFKVLGKMTPDREGRRFAILGDMRELGDNSSDIHGNLANDITANGIDMVYAAGPNMKHLSDALPEPINTFHAETSAQLVEPVLRDIKAGDIVLIKGSLGSKMKLVLEALVAHSDGLSDAHKAGV
ncbi:MAG: UDP-N-acetylmuramoylalanyl-D-glutamyl-2,6-diaminopimelate--D-alanyl-D-alanine ligase [Sneathiella sp.]